MSPVMAGRGAHAEFWDDEVELLAAGLLSWAVRKLLLARSTKGELEAWRTLVSQLSRRLIEQLGCDADVILYQIRLEHERRRSGRGVSIAISGGISPASGRDSATQAPPLSRFETSIRP